MQLNPYGEDAVRLACDLVNHRPRTADHLVLRCRAAGLTLEPGTPGARLDRVLDFLERWAGLADLPSESERAERLNGMLAEFTAHPRLTDHAGGGWHLHYRDPDLGFDHKLCALISAGTALHLAGRGMHRLGRCEADGCARVYADTSRNGRQRFCSTGCGNRAAVRRHRAKAAETTPG